MSTPPTAHDGVKFSIRKKLFVAFGAVFTFIALLGLIAWSINFGVKHDILQLGTGWVKKSEAARQMSHAVALSQLHFTRLDAIESLGAAPTGASQTGTAYETSRLIEAALVSFKTHFTVCREAAAFSAQLAGETGEAEDLEASKDETALLKDIEASFQQSKQELQAYLASLTAGSNTTGSVRIALAGGLDRLAEQVHAYESGVAKELHTEVGQIEAKVGGANSILSVTTFVILLVAVGLAWRISRTLTRPIRQLIEAAHQVGEGQFDTAIECDSGDELGVLTGAFNQMAADLQSKTVSKDYVDGILKAMADTLIVVQPDGTIKYVNQAVLTLLGFDESELIGQPFERLAGKTAKSLLEQIKRQSFLAGLETAYLTRNNTPLPMSFSASAMIDSSGVMSGVVCVAHCIAKRKQTESKMESLQKELVEASRAAGMAELATSVLHNVGNVLNSVNVASSLLADSLKKSRASNLSKVVTLIKEREADLGHFLANDPKGKQIPAYLAGLGEHLINEHAGALKELDQLQKSVEHVKEIVSMQQSLAKASGTLEVIKVSDIVEDALQMNANSFARHKIEVVRQIDNIPPITTHRHKILQILINLLRNAKQACDGLERPDKKLTVRVSSDEASVRVTIADNGIGIAPENLASIGTHGFTTKKDGHGFGLHSCMQAAKELGGALTIASEGLGKGATFTLELPLVPPKPQPQN